MTVRAALNRLVTAVIVITALLQMIVAAHTGPPRSRPIRTRAAARRWIRRLARITGVHIEVAGRLPPQEGM
ncbi:MAG TPA: hypothetical protein VFP54_03475 [Acidimicrobiales bacterium]|nr:hypothetical protein [Acidimicrobiales bacterium]